MIPCLALDSSGGARCGSLNTAVRQTAITSVTRVICRPWRRPAAGGGPRRRGHRSTWVSVSFWNMARLILTRDPFQSCYRCRPINSTSALAAVFCEPRHSFPELFYNFPPITIAVAPLCAMLFSRHISGPTATPRSKQLGLPKDLPTLCGRLSQCGVHIRELGLIEGENYSTRAAFGGRKADRLPQLAQELVRLKVDVIAAIFTPCALAAKQATRKIPIFVTAGDPIGNRPSGKPASAGANIRACPIWVPKAGDESCGLAHRAAYKIRAGDQSEDRVGIRADEVVRGCLPPRLQNGTGRFEAAWDRGYR